MKKKVLFVAALFIGAATFAQDGLTSKKGEAYLPEAGDWAVGFDAAPFLNYAGNMFNNGTNTNVLNASWANGNAGQTLMGKYFKDENTAYRGQFRLGMGGTSATTIQDSASASPMANTGALENEVSTSNGFSFVVGAGLEKRKGNTRIQGYYGGDLLIGFFGGSSVENTYGFAMDSLNVQQGDATSGRTLESNNGSTFNIGLEGFVGVEWFVAPKVSLGAEYRYGFNMSSLGEGETTSETWNAADQKAETNTVKTGTSGNWGFDTANRASINIMFHF